MRFYPVTLLRKLAFNANCTHNITISYCICGAIRNRLKAFRLCNAIFATRLLGLIGDTLGVQIPSREAHTRRGWRKITDRCVRAENKINFGARSSIVYSSVSPSPARLLFFSFSFPVSLRIVVVVVVCGNVGGGSVNRRLFRPCRLLVEYSRHGAETAAGLFSAENHNVSG